MKRFFAVIGLLSFLSVVPGIAQATQVHGAATPRLAPVTAYSAIPTGPLPQHLPSLGFQATQTSEFGDYVGLTTTGSLDSISVWLESYACQSGGIFNDPACTTTPGATFQHPVTVNLYQVDTATTPPSVGPLITSATQTFTFPFRPSASPAQCTGAQTGWWFSATDGVCYPGIRQIVTFPASDFPQPNNLPSQVIWTASYNTTNYGHQPIGTQPCVATPQGCPYDALNVGAYSFGSPTAFAGTDVEPAAAFLDSASPGVYCDLGLRGSGFLRDDVPAPPPANGDTVCWLPNRPVAQIVIAPPASATTVLATPPNPAFGQPATLTASVTCNVAVPTGTVTFFDGSTPLGTAPLAGVAPTASLTVNGLSSGSHSITAHYNGNVNCPASTSPPITVTVGCRTLSGDISGPLTITTPTCLAPGSVVSGVVDISGTGSLDAQHATINGPLNATGGAGLRMCDSVVNGSATVNGMNGVIVIGDVDNGCATNVFRNGVSLTDNTGFLRLSGNRIGGTTTVDGNTTTILVPPENAPATEIEANEINAGLGCTANTPPPTNDGKPNVVRGARTGQCAVL